MHIKNKYDKTLLTIHALQTLGKNQITPEILTNIKQKNSGSLNESHIEAIANQLASYSGINLYRTMNEYSECVENHIGNSVTFSPERIEELDQGACLLNWAE